MRNLYAKARRRFQSSQAADAVSLPFPLHAEMRLAQLSESAPAFGALKPFRPESAIHLQGFRPNMIVGSATDLQNLAEQAELGTVDLSSVDHAMIALTRCGEPPMTDVCRVVLWQTFGVPVFEIFVSPENTILGYECELHEGWHLAPDVNLLESSSGLILNTPTLAGLATVLTGYITHDKCPCGRVGARLLNIERVAAAQETDRTINQPWAASA